MVTNAQAKKLKQEAALKTDTGETKGVTQGKSLMVLC